MTDSSGGGAADRGPGAQQGRCYACPVPNVGPIELIILVVVLLLVFGSRKLPHIGRSLGSGMREFKDGVAGRDEKPPLEGESDTTSDNDG